MTSQLMSVSCFSNYPRQRDMDLFLDTHIVFRVEFHNYTAKSIERRLMQGPRLPDVTTATFFKVGRDRILSRAASTGDEIRLDSFDCNQRKISLGKSVQAKQS